MLKMFKRKLNVRVNGFMSGLWFCFLACGLSSGEIIYVPDDQPTIQIAISEAQAGDIIILQPGTYYEAINFAGKRITIQSIDPLDPAIVASTIIDDLDMGAVVTFLGNEDQNSQLKGITVTGGQIGIQSNNSTASISNCIIKENEIGIDNCKGKISFSEVTLNTSTGIRNSVSGGNYYFPIPMIIEQCRIVNNNGIGVRFSGWSFEIKDSFISKNNGTGIYIDRVTSLPVITDSTINNNNGFGIWLPSDTSGGVNNVNISKSIISGNQITGVQYFRGTIENSTIIGNKGHGIVGNGNYSQVSLLNCNIISNQGTGVSSVNGDIRNCIFWNNSILYQNSSTPVFSFNLNPMFVYAGGWDVQNNQWIEGNYNLSADSPCINAGDPLYAPTDPQKDANNNPRVVGPRIDIGAYEFNSNCTGEDFDMDEISDLCDKDMDNDGITNSYDPCDFTPMGTEIDNVGRPRADLNLDCAVNLADYAIMQRNFSE
jgi:hypothetical protein